MANSQRWANVPPRTVEALERYLVHRVAPGSFLRSVLENDLIGAILRADSENLAALPELCRAIWDDLSVKCYGSREVVEKWLAGDE